ncbi:MAG TPA: hypothetical protein IAC02_06210 [Candidatus Coprovivens excrementavium]|nr:hypothetical protein [Candidatus Coprovivens excrementavium]
MENEIKFDVEQVRSTMSNLETTFTSFADALKKINDYIETIVNAGADSAILGEYGNKLLQIWSSNASTFGDFYANFEAWSETVAVVSATNEDFVVDTLALYRDNGSTMNGVKEAREFVSENGRDGNSSSLSADALAVLGNASVTAAGVSVPTEGENEIEVTMLNSGDSITASTGNGLTGTFTYQGLVQRGDMSQEQIFSDKNGNLYYYEDGIMKPVNVSTTEYNTSGGSTTDYDKQATVDDLENKTLYFQNDNGKYGVGNANKSYDTSIDREGSTGTGTEYSIKTYDYNNFDINSDYEGKGTTILVPDENISGTNNAAKEMITTSIIDVRDNIAKEAAEMQTYLDANRESLTAEQISTIESQITSRNELASQMGEDVQFGMGVDDGAIGDWGTFYTNTDYEDVMQTINGYTERLDSLESIDEIINGSN